MFSGIFKQIIRHKLITGIILLLIIGGGYFGYRDLTKNKNTVRYVTAAVEKGTLIASISGSGQVSASNQVDIKSRASGDVVWIGIKAGQEVKQGQTILTLDDTDAKKAVADAELDLEETKLKLDKDIAQAPIDYARKLESLQKAEDDLEKEYEDTFNAVSNAFLDLPSVMTGVQNILFGEDLETRPAQWNINVYKNLFDREDKDLVTALADITEKDYRISREAYDKNFLDFKAITRYSEESVLEELLQETLDATKVIAQAVKSETNLLDTVVDIAEKKNKKLNPLITTFQSNLKSYVGTVNSNLSTLLAQKRSLEDTKETIINTERDISILEINNPTGINPIDLQIAQNSIKKKEIALADLKATLTDYVVHAPFTGIVAEINVKTGDSVSSGTVLATLITKEKIAEITLNEIDVAKVKIGQKANIAFDAIPDLGLTGEVAEIDTLGAVSQGVVSYAVKITFDTQDEGVKPGMSVSAAIITDSKQDVLLILNSAIKQQDGSAYAEVMINNTPERRNVEIGLSNDTLTEILNGLKEGERVVTQTITANSTNTTQTQSQNSNRSFGIPGFGGGR